MHSRKEEDVGITQYISSHDGFHGIIKMRFQDFLVNEIDQSGDIVHLTDMSCKDIEDYSQDDADTVQNADVLSQEEKEKLDLVSKGEREELILKAGDSKQERTTIHKAISWLYPNLESRTVDDVETNEKAMKVTKRTQKTGGRRDNRNTSRPKKYLCKFVLHKQNVGTMEAINMIAKRLRIHKANGFQYAGTKDKRAVTAQWVTAPVAAERLSGLNKINNNIRLGNFSYCKKPLQLGDLQGNHFSLVIRDVGGTDDEMKNAFESFSKTGFINYFGLQRFGTTSIPTYLVGIAILKSDWQKVTELILHPRNDDQKNADLNKGLDIYAKSGDAEAAFKALRFKGSIEGILLKGLSKFGKTQLVQAITMIPRNMRKMYVHSYQSYVWNRVASRRMKELGSKPVAGDLVDLKTYNEKLEIKDEDGNEGPPSKKAKADESDSVASEASRKIVRALTESDKDLFTINDIVLPLPGHDVTYPDNLVKTWYKEIMSEDGLDIDTHMVHKQKDYSLPGDYRSIVVRPARVDYDTVRYNDYTVPLLLTDLEKFENCDVPAAVQDGKYLALRVQFSLPTSCYATVALREILKVDVSVAAQMELNKQHGPSGDVADINDDESGMIEE